jgi:hypothetical protein
VFQIPISKALTDQTLYNRLVNALVNAFLAILRTKQSRSLFETFSQFEPPPIIKQAEC